MAAPGALALALALSCTQERVNPRADPYMEPTAQTRPVEPLPTQEPTMSDPVRTPEGALPIEEVAKYPLPGTEVAGSFQWSPDGRFLTSLDSADGSLVRELWV